MQDQLEKNKALVRRLYEEVLNQGKLEIVDELAVHPEYAQAFVSFINCWLEACPDSKFVIEAEIAEGDHVVIRYSCQGAVHTGMWKTSIHGLSMAVPPTGKVIRDHGICIFRIADGKIVEQWCEWDTLDVAQQMGVVQSSD